MLLEIIFIIVSVVGTVTLLLWLLISGSRDEKKMIQTLTNIETKLDKHIDTHGGNNG